ncbi:MAG: mannose-6-phosphate isomerase [Ruminococcaceae bacterium]|nr:mannose-6-phosphate isomerase [Oscillospiraceae bacterium]
MKKLYPIKVSYVAKSRIWGGENLSKMFGKENGGENIGETWDLTVREDEMSRVLNGDCTGMTLGEYIDADKSVMGTKYDGGRFPLLIKFIDAQDKLSVQVHPDDDYALAHEKDPGKTEMWYIVDAVPGAKIVYGLADGVSKEDFAAAVEAGKIGDAMGYQSVKAGETYFIPSGLLHAIGEGIIIAEIQQNSDLTYRVYDYERRDSAGNLRELHVEKSLDVVRPFTEAEINAIRFEAKDELDNEETLAHCRYFRVKHVKISGERAFTASEDSFASLLFLSGEGEIISDGESYSVTAGESFFIPAGMGDFIINGNVEVIISTL